MKLWKRRIALFCMVVMCMLPMVGQASDAQEEITLRFSWWGGDARHQATLEAIDLYSKNYPNIKVEAEYAGVDSYREKLVTQLAGGTAADVIQEDVTWLPDHIAQGEMYVDFNDYKDRIDLSVFSEGFLNDYCVVNGRLQALPTGTNALMVILNNDLLTKHGISLSEDWTWERILEEGKKLHEADENAYLLNADMNMIVDYILKQYVYQITGNQWIQSDYTMGFDKAALVEGLSYLQSLFDNNVLEPIENFIFYNGKKEQNPKWVNGELGMTLEWSSLYSASDSTATFELGVGRFPYAENGKVRNVPARPAQLLCVNEKSENKEAAVDFVNWFLTDPEAALLLKDARGVPAASSNLNSLVEAGLLNPNITTAISYAMEGSYKESMLNFNSELVAIEQDIIQRMAYGTMTPETAADELIDAFASKLNELKENQ